MRALRLQKCSSLFTTLSDLVIVFVLVTAALPAHAELSDGKEFLLAAYPQVGVPNQTRYISLQSPGFPRVCGGHTVSLNTSEMDTKNLVVIVSKPNEGFLCPLLPPSVPGGRLDFEFTPTKAGPLKIRWDLSAAEVTIQTVDATDKVASKFDVNGMWFDPATNGSGISLHHSRGKTDVAFGTWFLFRNTTGAPGWYTLQSTNWAHDGSVLEGLLYAVVGNGCATPNLAGCPGVGSLRIPLTVPPYQPSGQIFWALPSLARITFQSATRARAEVLSFSGTVLFTSELTKLAF